MPRTSFHPTSKTMKPCNALYRFIMEKGDFSLQLAVSTTRNHLNKLFLSCLNDFKQKLGDLDKVLVFLKGDLLYCRIWTNCENGGRKISHVVIVNYMIIGKGLTFVIINSLMWVDLECLSLCHDWLSTRIRNLWLMGAKYKNARERCDFMSLYINREKKNVHHCNWSTVK